MDALQNILFLIFGILVGGFLPFSLFYLALYFKRHGFGWRTLLGFLVRLVLIPMVFGAVLAIGGGVLELSGFDMGQSMRDQDAAFMGFGIGIGFLAGLIAFVGGLVSAVRARGRRGPGGQAA